MHPPPVRGRALCRRRYHGTGCSRGTLGVLPGYSRVRACMRVCARMRALSARRALQRTVASFCALTCSSTADSPGVHARAAASLDWLAQRCSSNRSCCRSSCCCSSCARWLTRSRSMRAGRTSTILVSTHATARSRSHALIRPHAREYKHTRARMHAGSHARVHTRALAHTNTPAHALSLDALTRSKRCCVRIRRCA
jgi:hypothetical protein